MEHVESPQWKLKLNSILTANSEDKIELAEDDFFFFANIEINLKDTFQLLEAKG